MECEGVQKPEAVSHLREDIALLLARWNGLQIAVKNQWGGRDSLQKFHQLAADILSWLFQSRGPLYVEDLENLLHESLLLSFNTEIEDGCRATDNDARRILAQKSLHKKMRQTFSIRWL
ncbi:conserved hypothetical protein [Ricinus communis]|uniref:Pre-rRNA-processing protein TSR2 n=1 Tax=Ricinus communis TaxID=3988 RepID=B9RTQ6_RICCO|nr:conserved hypothetical protein [Ricinus communis]